MLGVKTIIHGGLRLLIAGLAMAGAANAGPSAGIDDARLQASILHGLPVGVTMDDVHILKTIWNGQPVAFVDYLVPQPGSDDGDVALKLLVPVDGDYQARDVDVLEEEGGTAEVHSLAFANADKDKAKELIVLITWPVRHADVQGTLYEVRIFDDLAAGLGPLKSVSQHFDAGCECDRTDDKPSHYRYQTIKSIRKELKRLGY